MNVQLDFRSRIPIYVQVIEHIKEHVAAGVLKPGDQLPTVRQLATDLRINFNTVARAYRLLDEEGVISTQHGRGTYILERKSEENGLLLKIEVLEGMTRQYLRDAQRLGFSLEEIHNCVQKHIETHSSLGNVEEETKD